MLRTAPAHPRARAVGIVATALLGLGAALLAGGCAEDGPDEPAVADLSFTPVEEVTVDEGGFEPAELELTAGDVITLENVGDEPHSLTSTDPYRDTGELQPGETVVLRFDEPAEVLATDGGEDDRAIAITVVARSEPDAS